MVEFPNELQNGTFGLIARNVAAIYLILKTKYSECFSSRETVLATAGIIDAMRYIEANEIEPAEIISMSRTKVNIDNRSADEKEIYELSFFIRRLEVELLAIDTPIDYFVVRDVVSQIFPVIRKTVQEVFAQYEQDKKLDSLWERAVDGFMALPSMKNIRASIGIKQN